MIASTQESRLGRPRGCRGRSRFRARPAIIVVAAAIAGAVTGARAQGGATFPWTLAPIRVDPSREDRQRLPGLVAPVERPPRHELVVDAFPRVGADATFAAEGRRWRIPWVILPDGDRLCETRDGHRWACGLRARSLLSARLAGARLRCDDAEPATEGVATIECYRHGRSLALALLAEGWAEPTPHAPPDHVAAHRAAVATRRGLWSSVVPP